MHRKPPCSFAQKTTKRSDAGIDDPGFLETNLIVSTAVNGPKSSYRYLLSLTQYDMFDDARAKNTSKISQLKTELETIIVESTVGAFPGAVQWHRELDELASVIVEGRRTGWRYGLDDKYSY